jgi:hypothetical protein
MKYILLKSKDSRLTKPISALDTLFIRARVSASPMFPKMKRAEFLIFLIDSAACASTVGPIAMSRQYSTVAAHKRSTSAP